MGRVRDFVAMTASELEREVTQWDPHSVSCRVSAHHFWRLHLVSQTLKLSPSGCAGRLLEAAIDEAWEALSLEQDIGDEREVFAAMYKFYQDRQTAGATDEGGEG